MANIDHEFRELDADELAKVAELYNGDQAESMRVGPKGYYLSKGYKKLASDIFNMPLRPGDIFVASFQRSGTTWTQELVWLLANDLNYEKAAAEPITRRYPFLEDPRDVIVSSFHHAKLFKMKVVNFTGDFKQMWNAFYKDLFMLTPYFEHVKEAWTLRHHPNMMFIFYEDLLKDLSGSIRRVAQFLGKELTQEQIERLCNHLGIENFKKNKSVNYEDMREAGFLDDNETFIRKGKSGDWREYFDEEMTSQADRWIADKLRDTDLRFPSMQNNM